MLRLVSLLLVLLMSVPALGKECKTPVPMTSPCGGVLLPTKVATDALVCMKTCEKECGAKLKAEEKKRSIIVRSCAEKEEVYKGTITGLRISLDKAITIAQKPEPEVPFYKTTEFAFAAGLAIGALSTVGIVYALSPAVKQVQN